MIRLRGGEDREDTFLFLSALYIISAALRHYGSELPPECFSKHRIDSIDVVHKDLTSNSRQSILKACYN